MDLPLNLAHLQNPVCVNGCALSKENFYLMHTSKA